MKLIASGDMHLDGAKTPLCRTDDFYQAQVNALEHINELAKKHNAKRIDAGDIVDRAVGKSVSDAVKTENLIIKHIPELIAIVGNHCLKNKSLKYLDESIIHVPITAGNIIHVYKEPYTIPDSGVMIHGFNWGENICEIDEKYKDDGMTHIALYHGFVDEKVNTLIGGVVASEIVKEFHESYDFIVTADHHKPFTHTYKGCTLINVGSMMRLKANQIDYKPSVWLIDTETKEFEPLYLPIEEGVISIDHLQLLKDRDERIESFVISMDETYESTAVYEENIKLYIAANKKDGDSKILINKNVEKFVYKALEGDING